MQFIKSQKNYIPINRIKNRLYLDIESTVDRTPVEVTLIKYSGEVICDQIIKPHDKFFEKLNQKSHVGLTDNILLNSGKLNWFEMERILSNLFPSYIVVAWNLEFEKEFFSDRLDSAFSTQCEMKRFANYYQDYNSYYGDFNWKSLKFAAEHFGIEVNGSYHRSLTDAELLRQISLRLDRELFNQRLGMKNPTYDFKKLLKTKSENKING